MTTNKDAHEMMLEHHLGLVENVSTYVEALSQTVSDLSKYQDAKSRLVDYLRNEVLPHALAEENTIYLAATSIAHLAEVVKEMTSEHQELLSATKSLALTASPTQATKLAKSIQTFFVSHVAKENEVLLPALVADNSVNLAQLLVEMHGEMLKVRPVLL